MRRSLMLALVLGLSAPSLARAEEWPASVKGLKVVIPPARGRNAWGTKRLTRSLRATMKEGLGPLVPYRDFRKAQRKLRLRGRKRFRDENLVKAGREAGAQWVLDVQVTRKKWLYTATARLLNCETGEEQMNFRSQYYKPKKETKDRGYRIGKRTIEKLDTLTREGPLPLVAPDPGEAARPGSDPVAVAPPPDLSEDDVGTPPPAEDPAPGASGGPSPLAEDVSSGDDAPSAADAPATSDGASAQASSGAASTSATTRAPAPLVEDDTELLRFSLTAGAGLLRTYSLSSDAVASSRLSYQLSPLSLVHADAEIIVPGVPVTAIVKGAFRPVGYNVDVLGEQATASGAFVDASLMAGYHVTLSGTGRRAMRLIPLVGARLGLNTVGEDDSGILLSSTLVAVQAGLLARLPVNDVLEVNLGAEGGWIAAYSESPTASGDAGAGFTVAGELGARIWLSSAVAIAFDNRFTYEQIGFDGAPSRVLPSQEQANLQNVTISTQDLRASVGVAFRL